MATNSADEVPYAVRLNRRVEWPADAYVLDENGITFQHADIPHRPSYNSSIDRSAGWTRELSKPSTIYLNQFKLLEWPQCNITQYDIRVTPHGDAGVGVTQPLQKWEAGVDERRQMGVAKVLWNSGKVVKYRKDRYPDPGWIFDGKSIAWNKCQQPRNAQGLQEDVIRVDLDIEKNQPSRGNNIWNVVFRQTKQIKMVAVQGYLTGKFDMCNDVLECINFLDHALRHFPAQRFTCIKRSFFSWDNGNNKDVYNVEMIDNTLEFLRGCYASVRLCNRGRQNQNTGLAVNVDVANGIFWSAQSLLNLISCWMVNNIPECGKNWAGPSSLEKFCQPVQDYSDRSFQKMKESHAFAELRRFSGLRFTTRHRKQTAENKLPSTIKMFTGRSDMALHSKNTTFKWVDPATGVKSDISVYDFFMRRYSQGIKYWKLPLVLTRKGEYFPIEFCHVEPKQRYNFRTSPSQTATMIKKAVQRPAARAHNVMKGVRMLDWGNDACLKHFGIKIDTNMTKTNAILLSPPVLLFGGKRKISPGLSGRWNILSQKFIYPNPVPLKSWCITVIDKCCDQAQVNNFVKQLVQVYKSHGGNVVGPPLIFFRNEGESIAVLAQRVYTKTGETFLAYPQILLWVFPVIHSEMYAELKNLMDCRIGVVSQMVRKEQVLKATVSYCSNVCMKINAKLGGTTNLLCEDKTVRARDYWGPIHPMTMVIGADISHPAHGGPQASMAALTMSADETATRFWATCEVNGHRVEMLTAQNIYKFFDLLFRQWVETIGKGKGPQHIIYFRDGVSEGQFFQVLDQEVNIMKHWIINTYPDARKVAFTVIVCGKRHKIRFFPKPGDRLCGDQNDNPHPGTLVEKDVTHPFEYDFYLNSHSAIQGTARPTHYHVILNEGSVPPDNLQQMIYHHCYQYIRSTTPVSIHPAVYYAHLAAARSRAHENRPYGEFGDVHPRFGEKFIEYKQEKSQAEVERGRPQAPAEKSRRTLNDDQMAEDRKEFPPLMKLAQNHRSPIEGRKMMFTMWYI